MAKFKSYEDYIGQSQEFARPILKAIRKVVNEACPEASEEFKWGFPNFTYKGQILCFMASFKQHVSCGFWLGPIMDDPDNILQERGESSMGNFGKIRSVDDLPESKTFIRYIHHAMDLIDQGKKLPTKKASEKKQLEVPAELVAALKENAKARSTFDNFSYTNQKEYAEWISEAKREETKQKRLAQAIEWMAEGKPKNWKYM